jgi:hypothetical protein
MLKDEGGPCDAGHGDGAIQRSLVEPLVDGEPGRSADAQGVRDNPHVAQASPVEQPESWRPIQGCGTAASSTSAIRRTST